MKFRTLCLLLLTIGGPVTLFAGSPILKTDYPRIVGSAVTPADLEPIPEPQPLAAHGLPGALGRVAGSPYYYSPAPHPTGYAAVTDPGLDPGYYYHGTYGYGHGGVYGRHFGPGWHRYGGTGHYRFPYYNYRSPWYFPGPPVFNRDTNLAW